MDLTLAAILIAFAGMRPTGLHDLTALVHQS
jgi:hypothetical protein